MTSFYSLTTEIRNGTIGTQGHQDGVRSISGASASRRLFSSNPRACAVRSPWISWPTRALLICLTIWRSARTVQRSEPSSPPTGCVTGLSDTVSEAAWKPGGSEAFRANEASRARSDAVAYRAENSTCMVSVSFVPADPGG